MAGGGICVFAGGPMTEGGAKVDGGWLPAWGLVAYGSQLGACNVAAGAEGGWLLNSRAGRGCWKAV
ncbi:MAG: hypothetical protein CMJ75_12790 [Planctomycetaceae bacterium]|nr:hypothetical protein [Planctomycetaceae bacterium]